MSSSKEIPCRSWLLFGFAFFTVTCAAGLVYGWPALRRNLLEEGSSLSEESLGAIFTVGAWSTQGGRFFFGMARDKCLGTRKAACLALLCVTAGCLGIALSNADNGVALGVSLFFVGLGSAAQLCLQPVAGLFPKRIQGALLASLSGAFQVSGLVFLALTSMSSDRMKTFGGFAAGLAALTMVSAFILPKKKFEPSSSNGKEVVEEQEERLGVEEKDSEDIDHERCVEALECQSMNVTSTEENSTAFAENIDNNEARNPILEHSDTEIKPDETSSATSDNVVDEEGSGLQDQDLESCKSETQPTAMEQLLDREYIALVAWFSVSIIPLQYYVATIGFQLERKGDDSGFYTDLFSITYAASAAFAPLLGKFADVAGLGIAQAVATLLVAISMFTLVGKSLNAQIFGMSCYGIGRMMVFAMFFTNVGKRFGYVNYGTLAGLGLILSAIASLLQYPLIALSANGNESAVNIVCGAVLLCSLPYCAWLGMREYKEKTLTEAASS